MSKYTIRTVTVGYGVTVLSPTPGNVYKYYLEPTVDFEVPAECTKEELQETLDNITRDVLSMVQNSVRKKAAGDKAARQQAQKKAQDEVEEQAIQVRNSMMQPQRNPETTI